MNVNGGDTWLYESHHVCITCTFSFRFVCQGNQITKNSTNYYNFFCRPHFPSLRISSSSRTSARWGKRPEENDFYWLLMSRYKIMTWQSHRCNETSLRHQSFSFYFFASRLRPGSPGRKKAALRLALRISTLLRCFRLCFNVSLHAGYLFLIFLNPRYESPWRHFRFSSRNKTESL